MTAPAELPSVGLWAKVSEGLTSLPQLIRLLNQRLKDITLWARIVHARLNNETDFNWLAWGGKGDGATDNSPIFDAIHAAIDPVRGARVRVPSDGISRFYFSRNMAWKKPVRFVAEALPSTAAFTTLGTGTVLEFEVDKHGVSFENYITDIDPITQAEITRPRDDSNPGANYSIIEGFFITSRGGQFGVANGGTGLPVDGLKFRAPDCIARDCIVQDWSRDCTSVRGSIGGMTSSVPEIEGSPNRVFLINHRNWSAGRHGYYSHGADCNAGGSLHMDCSYCGDTGLREESFLGNSHTMLHTSSNGVWDEYYAGINAHNLCAPSYKENPDGKVRVMFPSALIGGNAATHNALSADSDGFVLGSNGIMPRRGLFHQNYGGAVGVGIQIGKYGATMVIMTFGSDDVPSNFEDFNFLYDPATKFWHLRNAGSAARDLISFPNQLLGLTPYALALRNGFYIGAPTDLTYFGKAAAMPAAGAYTAGTWIENTAPAVLGGAGSRYFVKGWKRLTTGAAHILNVDWVEARCLTGT